MSVPDLFDAHRRALEVESAILPEIHQERGAYTVTNAADLRAASFAAYQIRLPGLALPLHTVDGKILLVFRPDNPRVKEDRRQRNPDGSYPNKVIKYEYPFKQGGRLDCHPRSKPKLGNPSIPLIITEGQKKGDSLLSAAQRGGKDVAVIALLGVWNWRGKNSLGGSTVLADWESITLKGREVWMIFDSDYQTKADVRGALDRLTAWLTGRGAHVRIVHLPGGASGKGIDDYFAAGQTWADLESLLQLPAHEPQAAPSEFEILDDTPAILSRPLCLLNGRAWAGIWPTIKETISEVEDERSGKIIKLRTPEIKIYQQLLIVRDDGRVFGKGGDEGLESCGLSVRLEDAPPADKLWSPAGVKAYRAGRRPDPADVFDRLVAVIGHFIDFDRSLGDQSTMAEFLACYVLTTWLADAFNVLGFIWPNGERGSGKTNVLHIVAQLSYLGIVIMSGGSFASIRDLADYGALLAFDDAEELSDPRKADPDKRALMLAGNRRGAFITIKEPTPDKRTWRTRYVNAYCPRAFSAIHLPDPVLASRTIVIPLVRTADARRGNADPLDFAAWPHDHRRLIDDLWALSLASLTKLGTYDSAVGTAAHLNGRNLQPWRAVLAVASWLDDCGAKGLRGRMESLAMAYQKERPTLEIGDLTMLVIRSTIRAISAVCAVSAIKPATPPPWEVKTSDLVSHAKELIEDEELDFDPEYVTSRRVGRVLGKLRVKSAPRSGGKGGRGWEVSGKHLQQWEASYLVTLPNEILGLLTINGPNGSNGPNGTHPNMSVLEDEPPEPPPFDDREGPLASWVDYAGDSAAIWPE